MDESAAKLIASSGVWLSTQPLPAELANGFPPGSEERAKFQEVYEGVDRVYKLEDMARGDCIFAATGVTDGSLLSGVKRRKDHCIRTESIVMRASSGIGMVDQT